MPRKTATQATEVTHATQTVTDFLLILDRSGSMSYDNKWDRLVEGARAQLRTIQEDSQDGAVTNRVTVVILDETVRPISVLQVDPLNLDADKFLENMAPGGSTPLYDAMGTGIVTLETQDDGAPDHAYLVNIFTDGQENASKHYTAKMLNENVQRLQDTKRWTFTWSITEADLSIVQADFSAMPARNFQGYHDSGSGMSAASNSNVGSTHQYTQSRRAGETQVQDFYPPPEPEPVPAVVLPPAAWQVVEPETPVPGDATTPPPDSWT